MRTKLRRRAACALTGVMIGGALVACGDPSRQASGGEGQYPTRLVLADRKAGDGFHPATGYAQTGVSPIYDGLLRPEPSSSDKVPNFVPALAAEMPKHNADSTKWTVKLKEGVKFSDGSDFDAEDVKASYDVAKDISVGSEVVSRYEIIDEVQIQDPHTVVFKLRSPLAEMLSRLTYAIAPSEMLGKGAVTQSKLNTEPVGTGAYHLKERRGDETIFEANDNYFDGAPEVKELVVTTAADDTARAQRVAAGEIDGAAIPPSQLKGLEGKDGISVDVTKTADWRGISFPETPEFADPKVRLALNLAADRQAFIDGPLAGQGTPISGLLSSIYGDAHDPALDFQHDVAKAEKLLDEAGWKKNSQGVREKDGKPFHVDLYYAGNDTLRRDIAIEFVSQMKKLGLEFETKSSTWQDIEPKVHDVSVVLGGGSAPYDATVMAYEYLHTRTPETGKWANPGNYGSKKLDDLLDETRSENDEAKRNQLWRKIQAEHAENPSMLALANVNHIYVSKENSWKKPNLLLEPHIHGVTWGPWWRLAAWKK